VKPTYLTAVRAVLPDTVVDDAAVLIEDGRIVAVSPGRAPDAIEQRLDGATLIPGLVDLHCDAVEKEVEPRPNVRFALELGIAQADRRAAAAGITTPFHAIAFAHGELGLRANDSAAALASAVHAWRPNGLVDNRVHCRYEVTDAAAPAVLGRLLAEGAVDLLSFMDHTPGQGQFKTLEAYLEFIGRTYARSAIEAADLARRKRESAAGALERIALLAADATAREVPLGSHDDDDPARIARMAALGVRISEFPVTLDAARAAKAAGMHTVVGAPNVVRGASQSGSLRALDALRAGVADCLCADYSPASLVVAIFRLAERREMSLPAAVRLGTLHPARAAGLADRGAIAAGMRADLVAVTDAGGMPQVVATWAAGKLVHTAGYRSQSAAGRGRSRG
jgi:alpha-D-ribose 1-methylphosphonate 5-triphosphate diphosphatase